MVGKILIKLQLEEKNPHRHPLDTGGAAVKELIKDIKDCVKWCQLSPKLKRACDNKTSLVDFDATPLPPTLAVNPDKQSALQVKQLEIPLSPSCTNIADVDPVHEWIKAVIRRITQTVNGETNAFKVLSVQCDARAVLSVDCGTPCDPKTVRLVGKDSYAEIWTEINQLLDRTKDSFLLYLRLIWPTTCPDLTGQCQEYADKTKTDEIVFMQGQSSNYLSLKAPLLFMTMNRIKSVKHMLHSRVEKRCRAYLHKQTAARWRQSLDSATRLKGFPNLARQTITVFKGGSPTNEKTAWFKNQTVGELKTICRVLVNRDPSDVIAVEFTKNRKVLPTDNDNAFVETLFKPDDSIEAFVAEST